MSGDDFEMITPPDTLRDKVTYSATGVDVAMLERAEQVIASLQDNYLEWVQDDLVKLQSFYDQAVAKPEERPVLLKEIFRVAHDVKGQGGSFGYNLMTAIGNQLCRFVEGRTAAGEPELEVVKLHIDAMRLVINGRITGSGGKTGERIVSGLQAVVDKVAQK